MTDQNATSLPLLDMSTSVPLNQTPSAQTSALPKLDMSTSVPITANTDTTGAATSDTGLLHQVGEAVTGYKQSYGDVWDAVKSAATSPVPGSPLSLAHSVEQVLPLISTYERARQSGSSILDSLKASSDTALQHIKNIAPLQKAVDAFHANPTRFSARALSDAAALATSLLGGEAAAPEAEAATAAPGEEAVGSQSWLSRISQMNPFRTKAPTAIEPPVAAAEPAVASTSKIEPAVAARTAKAGLAPGEVGLTTQEASTQTTQSTLAAQKATQANIDETLQSIATRHATENGLAAPAAGTASRDLLTTNGDALVDAGKANYKILDKYTDGQFTNAQNELKNAQLELRAKAGTTDADTPTLEANVTRAQWNVDQLFDNAVKNGMPKETAEAARTQFRTGQATLDAGNAVRMANKARGAAGTRTTDLNVLENRWTALHDSGRLQQAFGEQGAKDALTQIHSARETGEIFTSLPPTESQALRELITKNTTTRPFGTTTNWGKVRDAFSQMPDRAARFSDIPKVEKFINNQLFYQRLRQIGAGAIGTVATGALGAAGYEAVRAATE